MSNPVTDSKPALSPVALMEKQVSLLEDIAGNIRILKSNSVEALKLARDNKKMMEDAIKNSKRK